jgi:4'-phosphopantetheinyl transferase
VTAAPWVLGPDPARLFGVLSDDERNRANRFAFERDCRQFVTTRAMLRYLPGGYRECDPADIEFGYNPHGKPRLITQGSPLEFNVSHSSDAAVFAFSRAGAVGVDVEAIRGVADGDLAERFFAPSEAQRLRAVPADRGYVGALAVRSVPRVIHYLACGGPHSPHQRGELARSRCLSQ